jgi:hypothetical protein
MRAPNLPVLFHPDCDRRLRNHTESADPADCAAGARGLWRSLAITAGGHFHPAPGTRSDRNPTNRINAPLAKPCNDFCQLDCTVSVIGMVPVRASRTSPSSWQTTGPLGDVRSRSAVRASDALTPRKLPRSARDRGCRGRRRPPRTLSGCARSPSANCCRRSGRNITGSVIRCRRRARRSCIRPQAAPACVDR